MEHLWECMWWCIGDFDQFLNVLIIWMFFQQRRQKRTFSLPISLAVADLLIGILTHYLYRFWRCYRHNFHLHSCCHFLGENVFRWFDSWLTNRTPASRLSNLISHSYDYRPNWTPLGPITFINRPSIVSDIAFFLTIIKMLPNILKTPIISYCLFVFFNESILKSLGLQAH